MRRRQQQGSCILSCLSALLNIVLDLVFVINFKMGTAGAAWATDLSQAISAVLCLIYIYRRMPNLRRRRTIGA